MNALHLLTLWPIEVLTFGLVAMAVGALVGVPIGYWVAHQPIPCECAPHRAARARQERASAERSSPPGGEARH